MTASAPAPERILQRLDWTVVRRLDGLLQGDYRSLFRGNGVDFADLREYEYGDDVRHIDWNVTARMDTPYIREFLEDREITAWFLLDLSPSVDFGTVESERLKRSVLVDFVTTLARVLTRHGNRVGAVFYGGAGRADDPGARRSGPGPAADQRPRDASAGAVGAVHRPDAAARGGPALDQGSLAGVRDLRLHQRAGLGAGARGADAAARGHRRAAVRPARGGAARRRAGADRRRRDRRAARTSTPRIRRSGAGIREAGERREAELQAAFRRAGVDAVSLVDGRGPARGDRPDGRPAKADRGTDDVVHLAAVAAAPAGDPGRRVGVSVARAAAGGAGGAVRVGVGGGRGGSAGQRARAAQARAAWTRRLPAASPSPASRSSSCRSPDPRASSASRGSRARSSSPSTCRAAWPRPTSRRRRMEAAKAAALAFVERQPPSVRIGIVVFSDTGFSTQVPTDDRPAGRGGDPAARARARHVARPRHPRSR